MRIFHGGVFGRQAGQEIEDHVALVVLQHRAPLAVGQDHELPVAVVADDAPLLQERSSDQEWDVAVDQVDLHGDLVALQVDGEGDCVPRLLNVAGAESEAAVRGFVLDLVGAAFLLEDGAPLSPGLSAHDRAGRTRVADAATRVHVEAVVDHGGGDVVIGERVAFVRSRSFEEAGRASGAVALSTRAWRGRAGSGGATEAGLPCGSSAVAGRAGAAGRRGP